jgi:hypothetical protein
LIVVAIGKLVLAFPVLVVVLPKSSIDVTQDDLYDSSSLFHVIFPFTFINVPIRIVVLADSVFFATSEIAIVYITVAEMIDSFTVHLVVLPVSFINLAFFVSHNPVSCLDLCLEIAFEHRTTSDVFGMALELALFPGALNFLYHAFPCRKDSMAIF